MYDERRRRAPGPQRDRDHRRPGQAGTLAERFGAWVWEDPARAERVAEPGTTPCSTATSPPPTPATTSPSPAWPPPSCPTATSAPRWPASSARAAACSPTPSGPARPPPWSWPAWSCAGSAWSNRPAYVVPNHMLEQFSRELLQLYPQARVLVATKDLTGRDGRKHFVARCATGDWDAVVITHSAFERLPLQRGHLPGLHRRPRSPQAPRLSSPRPCATTTTRVAVKRLEAAVARAEDRLETPPRHRQPRTTASASRRPASTTCSSTSSTCSRTSRSPPRIDGMRSATAPSGPWTSTPSSGPCGETSGHRVLIGATATPIANSIAEAGSCSPTSSPTCSPKPALDTFDAWAATFGQTVAAVELAPDGGSYRVTSRLARYRNVPELIAHVPPHRRRPHPRRPRPQPPRPRTRQAHRGRRPRQRRSSPTTSRRSSPAPKPSATGRSSPTRTTC